MNSVNIFHADCLYKLKSFPSSSIDLLLTDPPYGYNFNNSKKFNDKTVPNIAIWQECYRVLKPGAWCIVMSAPRQDVLSAMIHRLTDAGFKTNFTSIYWTYNTGNPKCQEIMDGAYPGFSPKPAVEVIIVCMKPLSEQSYKEQFTKNRKGCAWFNHCRIPFKNKQDKERTDKKKPKEGMMRPESSSSVFAYRGYGNDSCNPKGRYPANLLVSDKILNNNSKYFDIDAWAKENSFNESDLLGQIEPSPLDIFPFINIPKPCKTEKTQDSGSQVKNADIVHHPTVKPIKLFSYLATMFSRPNDVILDPFMGSGTTGIAALKSKRSFIGIEIVEEYYNLSKKRINAVHRRLKLTD